MAAPRKTKKPASAPKPAEQKPTPEQLGKMATDELMSYISYLQNKYGLSFHVAVGTVQFSFIPKEERPVLEKAGQA